jgi:hypothetical protein
MRKGLLCAAYLGSSLILFAGPACASYASIKINGFTVDAPKIYGADCAKPSTGTFADVKAAASFTNAKLDQDNNCIRFDYNGTTYYVHATNVDFPSQVQIDPKDCEAVAQVTQASGTQHASHVSMGAGNGCATKKK